MIAGEIAALLGSSAVAATLPTLIARWQLSSAQAGWLSGAYFIGYALAVPFLVSLTDRVDSRFVFALGCVLGAIASFGFAAFARDLQSATGFWALAGVSTAGIYMPGLRVIIDRVDPALRLRAVPYYTASFAVGVSLSFLAAGLLARGYGWPAAFYAAGCGCVVALGCGLLAGGSSVRSAFSGAGSGGFDWRAVLGNRRALRYIIAYGGHSWEQFALRAWLVAFLLFAWNRGAGGDPGRALAYWSSAIALAGVPASILGAECALRFGRRRLITAATACSVTLALLAAWLGTHAFIAGAIALLFYSVAVLGDSGALTAGVVDAAKAGRQGSTLALHSLVGFTCGALGPIAVGVVLSWGGGIASAAGWEAAFAVMAAGSALAALAVAGAGR
jgi:MFS family permease